MYLSNYKKYINYYVLNESQESDSQKLAMKLVMDKFGWDKERANRFVRVELRNDITSLRDKKIGKFTLGVTRMYCDGNLRDANTISSLNYTLKLLSAHINEYDKNLNGLSAQELISKFEQVRRDNLEQNKKDIEAMSFDKSDYEIVRIDSFEDAKPYYEYTNPDSRWCLTYMEDQYMNYTCNEINQLYFCLKHGFENIKRVAGKNTPLDDYGLSMLSVIVNEKGELVHCTCRWNHDNGGTDNVMDEKQISEVVGVNFYNVFKPNNKWNELITNVQERLNNGDDIEDIFGYWEYIEDDIFKVELNRKLNLIKKNNFLLDVWFNTIDIYDDDFNILLGDYTRWTCAIIGVNHKYALINRHGDIVSEWFDDIEPWDYDICSVKRDNKINFIDATGKLLSSVWFDGIRDLGEQYGESYILVQLNNKYNIFNTKGYIISPKQWFNEKDVSEIYFRKGYIDLHYKSIDLQTGLCFDNIETMYESDIKLKDGKYTFVDLNGKVHSKYLFDYVTDDWGGDYVVTSVNGQCGTYYPHIDKFENFNVSESLNMNNSNILYISIDLDNESRRRLKYFCETDVNECFGENAVYKCHHMTISHHSRLTPEILDWCQKHKGQEFTMYVDTIGFSDKAIAVGIDIEGVPCTQAFPHITVAINSENDAKPVDSNYIENFDVIWENVELKGKLTFHYSGEQDNTTLNESLLEWYSVLDNEMSEKDAYLDGYPGSDFHPEDMTSSDLARWCSSYGDFLYAYDFAGLRLSAANSSEIVDEIVKDIYNCGHIEVSHDIDYLILRREKDLRGMFTAVYKICDIPNEKNYYVVYQEER